MSAKLTRRVWDLDLPRAEKLVLLAFADWADDDGFTSPTTITIAKVTGYVRASVATSIVSLKERGLLKVLGGGHPEGKSVKYQIVLDEGDNLWTEEDQ